MSRLASFLLSLLLVDIAVGAGDVSFNRDIRPLFAEHCVACHGGVKQASGLSFIYRERALAETESGMVAIVPSDAESSYLIERVSEPDPDFRMPPAEHGRALTPAEIDVLRRWIDAGAVWEEHWSFVPPREQTVPEVEDAKYCRAELDKFVLAKLQAAGLSPSPPASKAQWLRRVSFDLIGLPPTGREIDDFLADQSPEAYERVVDRLLASTHYGERWATMWLDLARYADTKGYERDTHRDVWPYRDWLIRALNADLPYDEFSEKQLAGDLLPNATIGDRLATAFHRNTQTNTEGGADDEEFRTAAVIDRVSTTWQVWQATTFGCAQCHSHPYEPIEHEEFYRFLAIFNTTRDSDVDEDLPALSVPLDDIKWPEAESLDQEISQLRRQVHAQVLPWIHDEQAWRVWEFDSAESTGQTRLVIQRDESAAATELLATGTVTEGSRYTIAGPLALPAKWTALRIEVVPKDPEAALRTAELGFVLTRLQARLIVPGEEEPRSVRFKTVVCDEPEPMFDPQQSLRRSDLGWGDYSRMSHPRRAVFVLAEPIDAPAGSRLELVLEQNRTAAGNIPLVIERARFSLTNDPRWSDWLTEQKASALREHLADCERRLRKIETVRVPVMTEQASHFQRRSFVFERGNWLDKTEEVEADVPRLFPPLPTGVPHDRLAMARWLFADDNPLAARVMVNRLWEQLFGLGIVETVEDFGTSGTLPSHPELIDYLALRFRGEFKWSTKRLLRELVLSGTYRQTARATPDRLRGDPRNRLLSRGPRQRLSAEMVRDQALVLSGQWNGAMFGPPVMPPQPEGVWRSVYNGAKWENAEGPDRYRRAIYTYWKRTSGYPGLMTFDAPSREVCTSRRIATNTPLQALATLNDPAYLELAAGLAARMATVSYQAEEQIAWAVREVTTEAADRRAIEPLVALYQESLEHFDTLAVPEQTLGTDAASYARTILASAILNLDKALTR